MADLPRLVLYLELRGNGPPEAIAAFEAPPAKESAENAKTGSLTQQSTPEASIWPQMRSVGAIFPDRAAMAAAILAACPG